MAPGAIVEVIVPAGTTCARIPPCRRFPVNATDPKPTIVLVHADIVEVEGSHVIMISQPQAVTDHIVKAARAVAGAPR